MTEALSMESFYEEVYQIIEGLHRSAEISVDTIARDASLSLRELGFDSAAIVELAFFVEDLGATLPDELPWLDLSLVEIYSLYAEFAR